MTTVRMRRSMTLAACDATQRSSGYLRNAAAREKGRFARGAGVEKIC
jgi:hypothetical protein